MSVAGGRNTYSLALTILMHEWPVVLLFTRAGCFPIRSHLVCSDVMSSYYFVVRYLYSLAKRVGAFLVRIPIFFSLRFLQALMKIIDLLQDRIRVRLGS